MKKACVCFLVGGISCSALAFVDIKTDDFDKEKPIDFSADRVSYNKNTSTMTATGNVELYQNGILFQSEKILYNQKEDMIHIPGTALMTMPDGNKSTLKDIYLSPKTQEILTGATQINFIDGSQLWAKHISRQGNSKNNTLKDAYYTPCEKCENSAPLWQLHASSVEQDEQEHVMRFWNAFLEIKETPVLYLPYFQIPDFSVKRKSGFLLPGFGSDSTMDTYVKTPYFLDLGKNQNLTITPVISLTQNPLGMLDYQGLFTRGKLNFQGSFTQDDNHESQGHIKANFEYDINDQWRLSGEFFRTISDTYFRRYHVLDIDDSQSFLTSNLKAEYYGTRLQGQANFYHFQSLQENVYSNEIPIVLPTFQMTYTTQPFTEQGADFYTQISGAFINDRSHFKSNRLTLEQGVRIPYKTESGLLLDGQAMARFDGYSMDTGNNLFYEKSPNDSYMAGRAFPQASLKVSYPLAHYGEKLTQILEPIVMMIVAPNGSNPNKIINVDSTVFDFNDVNLFSLNRYAGYDRVESGTRMNYGVQWSLYPKDDLPSVQFLFGQSYRLKEEAELNDPMGFREHFSSYVGHLKFDYRYAMLMYRFRLAEKDFNAQKNDIIFEVGDQPLRLGIDYLFQEGYSMGNEEFDSKKEFTLYGRSQLTKDWSLTGRYRYNLLKTEKGPLEASLNLRYDNDCAAVEFSGSKSYTEDRNYKGNTSFSVHFYLKTLGGFGQ